MSYNMIEKQLQLFEGMYNQLKPKSRYISEVIIEEETDCMEKEIINGDTQVSQNPQKLDKIQKPSHQDIMKKRYIQQIQKEKQHLQHKLGYIQNTLAHLQSKQYLRRSSVGHVRTVKPQQWREEHVRAMKELQHKKKQLKDKNKEKQQQAQLARAHVRNQQQRKRRSQLQASIKKMKQRQQQRNQVDQQQKQQLKQVLNRRQLYQKMQSNYLDHQQVLLMERKRKLAEIRALSKPINFQELQQHQERIMQMKKNKQDQRQRQIYMKASRSVSYKPSYVSSFYKQLSAKDEDDKNDAPRLKAQKIKQFSQEVKSKHLPQVDQRKRRQIQQKIEKQSRVVSDRQAMEKQRLEKPRIKGMKYLQMVKQLPKKKKENSPVATSHSERIQYKNYLGSMSVDASRPKQWQQLLEKQEHKLDKAMLMQIYSQKAQERLKRKQEYEKIMKIKDDGSIDEEYYRLVKAKLDLLTTQ